MKKYLSIPSSESKFQTPEIKLRAALDQLALSARDTRDTRDISQKLQQSCEICEYLQTGNASDGGKKASKQRPNAFDVFARKERAQANLDNGKIEQSQCRSLLAFLSQDISAQVSGLEGLKAQNDQIGDLADKIIQLRKMSSTSEDASTLLTTVLTDIVTKVQGKANDEGIKKTLLLTTARDLFIKFGQTSSDVIFELIINGTANKQELMQLYVEVQQSISDRYSFWTTIDTLANQPQSEESMKKDIDQALMHPYLSRLLRPAKLNFKSLGENEQSTQFYALDRTFEGNLKPGNFLKNCKTRSDYNPTDYARTTDNIILKVHFLRNLEDLDVRAQEAIEFILKGVLLNFKGAMYAGRKDLDNRRETLLTKPEFIALIARFGETSCKAIQQVLHDCPKEKELLLALYIAAKAKPARVHEVLKEDAMVPIAIEHDPIVEDLPRELDSVGITLPVAPVLPYEVGNRPLDILAAQLGNFLSTDYVPGLRDLYNTQVKGSRPTPATIQSAAIAILNHMSTKGRRTLEQWNTDSGNSRRNTLNRELTGLDLPAERWARHLMKQAIGKVLAIMSEPSEFKSRVESLVRSRMAFDSQGCLQMNMTFKLFYTAYKASFNPADYEHPDVQRVITNCDHRLLQKKFHDPSAPNQVTSKSIPISYKILNPNDPSGKYDQEKENNAAIIKVILYELGLDHQNAYYKKVVDTVLADQQRTQNGRI